MNLLRRGLQKHIAPPAGGVSASSFDEARPEQTAHQRFQAKAKVIQFHLDDRMRTFRPMIERVLRDIETRTDLRVLYPQSITYGFDDPYFPTYEWKIYPGSASPDAASDPRQVTLQLRASLGRDLTVILVYYLLSFTDASGDEHPIHQQPTRIDNETLIRALLWDATTAAGLVLST